MPRLILRQFTEDDVDNLFTLNSDPEVISMGFTSLGVDWVFAHTMTADTASRCAQCR